MGELAPRMLQRFRKAMIAAREDADEADGIEAEDFCHDDDANRPELVVTWTP